MRLTMGFAKKISLFEGDTFTVKYQPKVLTVQASRWLIRAALILSSVIGVF